MLWIQAFIQHVFIKKLPCTKHEDTAVKQTKKMVQIGSPKSDVVRNASPIGARGTTYIGEILKQRKKIFDWISLEPSWLFVIGGF